MLAAQAWRSGLRCRPSGAAAGRADGAGGLSGGRGRSSDVPHELLYRADVLGELLHLVAQFRLVGDRFLGQLAVAAIATASARCRCSRYY